MPPGAAGDAVRAAVEAAFARLHLPGQHAGDVADEVLAGLFPDIPVRRCAAVDCGKDFRFQEGESSSGRRRSTGVKYCSRRCAKRQGERERRAVLAAKRERPVFPPE